MEDLVLSLDRQNAEDLMRPTAPAAPGYQSEQLIEHTEQHAPPSVQSPDAGEPSSPREASEQASDDSDPNGVSLEETDMTGLSLEDTIRKYVPDGSDIAISLEQRQTLACYVGDGFEAASLQQSDSEINRFLDWAEARERPYLLVIQDASIHWSKALCAKYPDSLTPELLAGHIIRFDKIPPTYGEPDAIESHLEKLYHNANFTVSSSGSFMSIDMDETFTWEEHRFNLDFIVGSYHGEASAHLSKIIKDSSRRCKLNKRSDVFERDEQNNWRRISVRLSCIRLAADFRKTGTLTSCRDIFADDQF
jgi:hypothetical protein